MITSTSWPATCSSEYESRPVDWLWRRFIAAGKLGFFGAGGLGKTMIAVDLASTITTGRQWPDKSVGCTPGAVAYLMAEDGIGDTVRPRVEAVGGDITRVHILDNAFRANGKVKFFSLRDSECTQQCGATLRAIPDLRLFIIDPISAFLGKGHSHKIADVRTALLPLSDIAESLGPSVVFIHHVNKTSTQKSVHRASGSTAFIDAVRVAFMVDEISSVSGERYVL